MQCKDIPDAPILEFLAEKRGHPCNWFDPFWSDGRINEFSVCHAMPKDTPQKLALAKMRSLIKRGLVLGCDCGCRGDFVLAEPVKKE